MLLSGYRNEMYDAMLPWERFDWSVGNQLAIKSRGSGLHGEGALKGKQKRVESLWWNYEFYGGIMSYRRQRCFDCG